MLFTNLILTKMQSIFAIVVSNLLLIISYWYKFGSIFNDDFIILIPNVLISLFICVNYHTVLELHHIKTKKFYEVNYTWETMKQSISETIKESRLLTSIRNKYLGEKNIIHSFKVYFECAVSIVKHFPQGVVFYNDKDGFFYTNQVLKYILKKIKQKQQRSSMCINKQQSFYEFYKQDSLNKDKATHLYFTDSEVDIF
jgi:hypothetical protein